MSPRLSVVMPTRTLSPFLGQAIDSILHQSMDDLELILVGYPDIKQWQHQLPRDPRIRVLTREKPGIVSALNAGLKSVSSEFFARMDDDDIALPTRFEKQLDLIEKTDIQLVGAKVEIFVDAGTPGHGNLRYMTWLNSLITNEDIKRDILVESPLPHPTLFCRTDVMRKLGGYRDCDWAEDYDLLLRGHLNGMRFGKPDDILLRWREHKNRLTRLDGRYSTTNFIRAKAWALTQGILNGREAIICGTGRNARDWHDALIEFGATVRCFIEHDSVTNRTSKRNRPVIRYQQLLQEWQEGKHINTLILSVISNSTARQQIRERFAQQGLLEGDHFLIAG